MKKTCTFLVLACSIANAQITITKDTSFGNNGTVSGLGSSSPNDWLLLIPVSIPLSREAKFLSATMRTTVLSPSLPG